MPTLAELRNTLPQVGTVEWIGVRPARRATPERVASVVAAAGQGLAGDHYAKAGGDRQVTLIQAEHLECVGSMLGREVIDPASVRRNIVVRGVNLLALKEKRFRVGDTVLEFTGLCVPCSLMESTLGPGGYNAMRGHGGITAAIVESGRISTGDAVEAITG